MRAGSLNQRVTIRQRATGSDELGQPVDTWSDVAIVWADIRYASGMESIKAGAEMSTARASIRIRWRTDITPAMRVVHGSTVYRIEAVLPDMQRRDSVTLVCEVTR